MRVEEDVRLSARRQRAEAAILVKIPFYLIALTASLSAFGFWKTALLFVLFLVVGGRRGVSAVTARLVGMLPIRDADVEVPRHATGANRRRDVRQPLVIDLRPGEFSRIDG
jgi:hypothetical protein